MTPLSKFTCSLAFAMALALPAYAASGDAGSGPTTGSTATNDAGSGPTKGAATDGANGNGSMNSQSSANGGSMHIAQKMRDDLSKAGFTDIHIMPSSFLVRAKDSAGNPVMMVVNPDSITAITEETSPSASSYGGAGSNTGATPGPKSSGGSQPVTPGNSQTKP